MQTFGIFVTFEFGECAPRALGGNQLATVDRSGVHTSYEPNLIADSGITLITLRPFPVKSAIGLGYESDTHQQTDSVYRPFATVILPPRPEAVLLFSLLVLAPLTLLFAPLRL